MTVIPVIRNMKKIAALILLTVCGASFSLPAYGSRVPSAKAQAKAVRKNQKRQNKANRKYAKAQRKAEKRMIKKDRKNTHLPGQRK